MEASGVGWYPVNPPIIEVKGLESCDKGVETYEKECRVGPQPLRLGRLEYFDAIVGV